MTNKTNGCCEKCVAEDANGFHCFNADCPCHSHKTNGWREKIERAIGMVTTNGSLSGVVYESIIEQVEKLLVEERRDILKRISELRLPAHEVQHEADCIECKEIAAYNEALVDTIKTLRSEVTEKV